MCSLKFNLLHSFKLRFDWVHGKMPSDTHLMVIYIDYVRDTKEIVTRFFNKKYCREYSFYFKHGSNRNTNPIFFQNFSEHSQCVKDLWPTVSALKVSVFGVILVSIFPAFSRIQTEYGEIICIFPFSVQMRENEEKMRTRITRNTDTFYAVCIQTLMLDNFNVA